jgi:hypothetical protein
VVLVLDYQSQWFYYIDKFKKKFYIYAGDYNMKNLFNRHIFSLVKTRLNYFCNEFNPLINFIWNNRQRRKKILLSYLNWFNDLKKKGYVVVNNYITRDECEKTVLGLKQAFERYPKFIHENDDKRIFGVEQILSTGRKLAEDLDLLELGELVNQERTYCAFTLGNWLKSGNNGSSGGGWHRDSFFNQYKALIYLTDVSKDNGPLQVLPGSHHLNSVLSGIKKVGLNYMQDRISDYEVSKLEEMLTMTRETLIGNKGTLVLFNSSIIHRGSPIKLGERLALTNYYMPISRDLRDVRKQFEPVLVAADV